MPPEKERTDESALVWVQFQLRPWMPDTGRLAVTNSSTDEFYGSVSIHITEDGNAEVGFWTMPDVRGKGHATEAVKPVTRWAIEELGVERDDFLDEALIA